MAGENALAVAGLVTALIEAAVPELEPSDARATRLLHYAMRILGSSMSSSAPATVAQSAELARRRLVQSGRTGDALALTERLQRLDDGAPSGWHNLPAVVQLLTCLMQSPPPGAFAGYASGSLLSRPGAAAAATVPRQLSAAGSQRIVAPEPNGTTDRASRSTDGAAASRGGRRRAPAEGGVSEETLVRELLFVMQNIEGRHLRWDSAREAFVFHADEASPGANGSAASNDHAAAAAGLPPGMIQMVERIAEIGWMYRVVASFVEACTGEAHGGVGAAAAASAATTAVTASNGNGSLSGGGVGGGVAGVGLGVGGGVAGVGLVARGLSHGMLAELAEWLKLLAVLEAQVRQKNTKKDEMRDKQ